MIIKRFFTDKYDNDLIFVRKDVTFEEFKDYVFAQKKEFEKSDIKEIALLCENYFDYAVNFFAAIFAGKNINLVTDKSRLKLLNKTYMLPEKPVKKLKWQMFENIYNPKDIKINFFTSGSTGVPQSIIKSLYNVQMEAQATVEGFNLASLKGITICATTLCTHSYGLTFGFIMPFDSFFKIYGTRIEFPEQLPKDRDYIMISTPSFMEKLTKYNYKFPNPPKLIFLAGAKLDENVYNYISRFSDVVDIYGSTETGNIAYKRGGNVFNVFHNVEVGKNEDNRIIVKSEFFTGEQAVLNDIIENLENRQFTLKKRSDRIVKVLEKRISLTEMENTLKKRDDIEDAYCFKYKEMLAAVVVTKNYDLTGTELKKYLAGYIEVTPKKWRFLDEIPRNISGKIDYEKIKHLFDLNLSLPFVINKKVDELNGEIKLKFKRNSNFLNGHFDIKPIVPGVVQLYFAKFFAKELFNLDDLKSDMKKIKFSNIINPDEEITLKLTNKEDSVAITYLSDDKIFSSGILVK